MAAAETPWGRMRVMDRPEVKLARDLVRAFSPSGSESPATTVLAAACRELGFDTVTVDEAGNLVARLERGSGPMVMLNGHLDTVPLGDEAQWAYPPLSGALEEGRLWGRGSSDMKSSLACMAVAAAAAADQGFAGTLMLTGVVQEEVGGLGARHLSERLKAEGEHVDVVILGEPSSLQLMLGHRGRVELEVSLPGRIAHAAKSELGENALYRAAAFLELVRTLELPTGGPLRGSTATPTRLTSFPQDGANVVPGEARITIDYRNLPVDGVEDIVARLGALDPQARVVVPQEEAVSENGKVRMAFPRVNDGYLVDADDSWVSAARDSLHATLERHGTRYDEGVWWFATDAPLLAEGGGVVIGFGPGEPELAHTTRESVDVGSLEIATDAYRELILALMPREGGLR